jgi:hypothetical protein
MFMKASTLACVEDPFFEAGFEAAFFVAVFVAIVDLYKVLKCI